jgi:group II intron reverse transcriptase/maturase
MRSPKVVLDSLVSKSKHQSYKYKRLYRNFYNKEFFLSAYSKIYSNKGSSTKGINNDTIDSMSVNRIERLIEKLKDQSYRPNPVKRIYIPKANGKQRPLGIPTFEDKLVQEIARSILEAIYEPQFSNDSHGFRMNRSCHTALKQIKNTFTGARWFVEGDIKGFFDNIDHHIIINILRERIDDEKFINLIWKFLRAGYVENWVFHNTFSGTPQGGIISPILSNIYLDVFDKYMAEYIISFNKGDLRKYNPEYHNLASRINHFKYKNKAEWATLDKETRTIRATKLNEMYKQLSQMDSKDLLDPNYRRLKYVRYADDFILGIIGSKNDAERIKKDLTVFLAEKLKLELSQEKTLITHTNRKARFLGYDVKVTRDWQTMRMNNGTKKRKFNFQAKLYVPKEKWTKKLFDLGAIVIVNNSWKPTHRPYLLKHDDLEIIMQVNAEIRGLYNYYRLACNVHVLQSFRQNMKFSMMKTYANKYRSTMSKMLSKYQIDGKIGVRYKTKDKHRICYFIDRRMEKDTRINNESVDEFPMVVKFGGRTSLIDRLLAEKCEWCNTVGVPLEMHHVRKLKDLKGKSQWEAFMIARNRKTIAMCVNCHKKLHKGILE